MPGHLSYTSADAPTTEELERAAVESERLGLVIRVRWFIIAALVAYSVVTLAFYEITQPFLPLRGYLLVPAVTLVVVLAYNGWYQLAHDRLSHLRYLPHFQILGDIMVATVLVHYSGGVNSWFWTMYLLFSVEAAFILREEGDTWLIGAFGTLVYGALLVFEYFDVIRPVSMPWIGLGQVHNFTYVMILWSWVVVMNGTVALVGNAIMRRMREREAALRASAVFDAATGLYNRRQLIRLLGTETERARRHNRDLSVLLLGLDAFRNGAASWGPADGNEALRMVAGIVRGALRTSDDSEPFEVDFAARCDGQHLAVVAPDTGPEEAVALAERIREAVEAVCAPRPASSRREALTVSAGVASYPQDGGAPWALLDAARRALDESSPNTVMQAAGSSLAARSLG